ncbi:hypothetical protein DVH24_039754 [Malus domestica]|uniref:Malate synthase C-terminal domain-containing protein n=1 Tax=Malus domestica TaxID=3750 RepID=A0A498I9K0_MALDO|nr:hypothetical protein DVH24_039754 [Malus domestica]
MAHWDGLNATLQPHGGCSHGENKLGVELAVVKYGVESDRDRLGVRVENELFGRDEVGNEKFKKGMYNEACRIFTRQCTAQTLNDFLTLDAYNRIVLHYLKGLMRL